MNTCPKADTFTKEGPKAGEVGDSGGQPKHGDEECSKKVGEHEVVKE